LESSTALLMAGDYTTLLATPLGLWLGAKRRLLDQP
jgi:hypothetical protein